MLDKELPTQEEIDAAYADLHKGMRNLVPVHKDITAAARSRAYNDLVLLSTRPV